MLSRSHFSSRKELYINETLAP